MTSDTKEHGEDMLIARITEYLSTGGLFNPELMDHKQVSALLLDCRNELRQRPTPERPPHQGLIEALVYCAEDMDGWIAATKRSLSDPRFGIAIRDHEKFIAESRADLAARERHIVELRNHIAALEAAAKGKP